MQAGKDTEKVQNTVRPPEEYRGVLDTSVSVSQKRQTEASLSPDSTDVLRCFALPHRASFLTTNMKIMRKKHSRGPVQAELYVSARAPPLGEETPSQTPLDCSPRELSNPPQDIQAPLAQSTAVVDRKLRLLEAKKHFKKRAAAYHERKR